MFQPDPPLPVAVRDLLHNPLARDLHNIVLRESKDGNNNRPYGVVFLRVVFRLCTCTEPTTAVHYIRACMEIIVIWSMMQNHFDWISSDACKRLENLVHRLEEGSKKVKGNLPTEEHLEGFTRKWGQQTATNLQELGMLVRLQGCAIEVLLGDLRAKFHFDNTMFVALDWDHEERHGGNKRRTEFLVYLQSGHKLIQEAALLLFNEHARKLRE
ncbi:MAG: hypothetical protein LQ352_005857 [Teloschistes flavicans]|nr:MAG: hypothetical protein LQ352_005857 [Teloschistes flavicans]